MLCPLEKSKAFDIVDQEILMHKLEQQGYRSETYNLLFDYLGNHKHLFAVFQREKSDISNAVCGMPQKSILGPLLFLFYNFDLSYAFLDCQVDIYADGTSLFCSGENSINKMKKKFIMLSNGL